MAYKCRLQLLPPTLRSEGALGPMLMVSLIKLDFAKYVAQLTGQRREARPRGRPRVEPDGPVWFRGSWRWGCNLAVLCCCSRPFGDQL